MSGEQHVPTTEEVREAYMMTGRGIDFRGVAVAQGFDASHDDAHGREHLIGWAVSYALRGETLKAAGLLAALNLYDGRHPRSPQPDRETAVEGLRVAMLGTTDG